MRLLPHIIVLVLAPLHGVVTAVQPGDVFVASSVIGYPYGGHGEGGVVRVDRDGTQHLVHEFHDAQAPLTSIGDEPASLTYAPSSERLYVAVHNGLNNDRDRVVSLAADSGTVVQESASGESLLRDLSDLTVDPVDGTVLAVGPARVVRLSADLQHVSLVASLQFLDHPESIAISHDGALAYVADSAAHAVIEIDLASGSQRQIVKEDISNGAFAPFANTVHDPTGLVVDSDGTLIVSEVLHLARIDIAQQRTTNVLWSFDEMLGSGNDLALDVDGSFVIADFVDARIVHVARDGGGATISEKDMIALPRDVIVVGGTSNGGSVGICGTLPQCLDGFKRTLDALIAAVPVPKRQAARLSSAYRKLKTLALKPARRKPERAQAKLRKQEVLFFNQIARAAGSLAASSTLPLELATYMTGVENVLADIQ